MCQLRHNPLRKQKISRQMKTFQPGTESAGQVAPPGPVPVLNNQKGRQETNPLEAVVHLGTLLPAGWRAELGPGSITLSWRTG